MIFTSNGNLPNSNGHSAYFFHTSLSDLLPLHHLSKSWSRRSSNRLFNYVFNFLFDYDLLRLVLQTNSKRSLALVQQRLIQAMGSVFLLWNSICSHDVSWMVLLWNHHYFRRLSGCDWTCCLHFNVQFLIAYIHVSLWNFKLYMHFMRKCAWIGKALRGKTLL